MFCGLGILARAAAGDAAGVLHVAAGRAAGRRAAVRAPLAAAVLQARVPGPLRPAHLGGLLGGLDGRAPRTTAHAAFPSLRSARHRRALLPSIKLKYNTSIR